VRTVLLSHAHLDHAGLAARWQAHGARILAGRADAPALALDAAARERERDLARRELLRHGVPPDLLIESRASDPAPVSPQRPDAAASARAPAERPDPPTRPAATPPQPPSAAAQTAAVAPQSAAAASFAALTDHRRYTRWPAPLRMTAVHPDGRLDDGDLVEACGRRLRIVACPGHTPGTVLILDEATGALFTGDHILPRMAPTSGIQFADGRRRPSLPRYLESLQRARHLAGRTTVVYPGHGRTITDLAEAVDWAVRVLEQRARRLALKLERGPATAFEVAVRMFAHLEPPRLRPVIAETIGLLDLLAERGQAVADETPDQVIWRTTAAGRAPDTATP
jgi:glyoxylase-like metal-dependent hydrolase (beta-lactamase superfamily II)